MDPKAESDRILKTAGAVLQRKRKHEVWSLPNGQTFIRSCTPGDTRASKNQLRDLRKALGIVVEPVKSKREKPRETKRPVPCSAPRVLNPQSVPSDNDRRSETSPFPGQPFRNTILADKLRALHIR